MRVGAGASFASGGRKAGVSSRRAPSGWFDGTGGTGGREEGAFCLGFLEE